MQVDDLEFRLSQYLDGTLTVDEAGVLLEELAKNPDALAILDEYRRLDLLLKTQSPEVEADWAVLAKHISGQIEQSSRWTIGRYVTPLRVLAAATASIMLITGVTVWLTLFAPEGTPVPIAVAQIAGPTAEPARGAAVMQIDIGPSPAVAGLSAAERYADLVQRPTQVAIAVSSPDRADERNLPY